MFCHKQLSALVFTLLAAAPPVLALSPGEVLVVGNKSLPDSVHLVETYAELRGIPSENVLLIKTGTGFTMTRKYYDDRFVKVIKQTLIERNLVDRIRCIVLMWGVPVRVMGPSAPPLTPVQLVYRKAAEKAHYRLAIAYDLLGDVSIEFPAPRTNSFKPLGALFSSEAPAPQPPLAEFSKLTKNFESLLDMKQKEIASVSDASKRQIAWRQLMALHLEVRGLKGLSEFVASKNPPTAPTTEYLEALTKAVEEKLEKLGSQEETPENIEARLDMINNLGGAMEVYARAQPASGADPLSKKKKSFEEATMTAEDATVDSELSLIWYPEYKLKGWVNNPLHWRIKAKFRGKYPPSVMTARIDGPSADDAMRIIKESVEIEKTGLQGNFYIDTGGRNPQYDVLLRRLHSTVKNETGMKTVLNVDPGVFPEGSCPDAALYVGWYSLKKYVPAFEWKRGAVGWHVASFEAQKLRDPNSQIWCVKMIQNGVAATMGAVAEPLLMAFANPNEFFPLLLTGKYALAECYWRTVPSASWRMTLIGDPLYNPFAANPQLDEDKLPKGLAPPRRVSPPAGVSTTRTSNR